MAEFGFNLEEIADEFVYGPERQFKMVAIQVIIPKVTKAIEILEWLMKENSPNNRRFFKANIIINKLKELNIELNILEKQKTNVSDIDFDKSTKVFETINDEIKELKNEFEGASKKEINKINEVILDFEKSEQDIFDNLPAEIQDEIKAIQQ